MKKLILFSLTQLIVSYCCFSQQALWDIGGQVGIGTSSPQSILEVREANDLDTEIHFYNSETPIADEKTQGVSLNSYLKNGSGGKELAGQIRVGKFNDYVGGGGERSSFMTFSVQRTQTEFIEAMRIQRNGHIGIGSSDPQAVLDIEYPNDSDTELHLYNSETPNADEKTQGVSFNSYLSNGSGGKELAGQIRVGKFNDYVGGGGERASFMAFSVQQTETDFIEAMRINRDGKVGIGTTAPDAELTVDGTIHSEEIKVDLSVPGPDYVFAPDYDLRSLEETSKYISENRHLPEIPSAKEMEAHGIDLGVMNMKLLQKVEELTLYLIEQNKQIQAQQARIAKLEMVNAEYLKNSN